MSNKKIIVFIMSIIIIIIIIICALLFLLKNKEEQNNNYNNIISNNSVQDEVPNTPVVYEFNRYRTRQITDAEMADIYFQDFVSNLASNAYEYTYSKLDEQYKQQKYKTIEEFKNMAQTNKSQIMNSKLQKYEVKKYQDYTQYICIDQYGKYYIFKENAIMQYTTILDTYTIDLPEFLEKYNKASENEKALLNIQRFFDSIEDGDYQYAYNKLDQTFRSNNFKTLAEFEKYVKDNFYANNKLKAEKQEKQNDLYISNITIQNGDTEQTITKTFVVQLKEGTDFVMSFSVSD